MNSRETQEASGKSQAPKRTLAKRIADIIPSSITKWFKNLQSSEQSSPEQSSPEQSSPDSGCLGEPEPKRRRLSEDPNKYLPTTACASTNTDSLYSQRLTQKRKSEDLLNANAIKSPEDAVNRVSFILKSSLRAEDDPKTKETYVDHNRTPGSPFYPGNTTYGGASNHLSQYTIKKRNDFIMSGRSKRIMNVFENYSSPLEEVRRISQFVSNENNNNLSTAMSNDTSKHIATRSQELHVPSIASILSLKKKPGLMASTSTARQLLASQSSATKHSPYGVYKNSDSVKQRLHNSNRKERRAPTSSLPTASTPNSLKINIGNLHNMTFTTSTAKVTNISQSPKNIEELQKENSSFQFPNAADAHSNTTENDCRVTVDSSNTNIDTTMTDDDDMCKNTPSSVMTTECRSDEEENGTEDPCVPNRTNSLLWTCEDCWIKNNMSISICVCCGGKKPQNKGDTNKTSRPADNITYATLNSKEAEVQNSQDENWECNVCLVRNDKRNSKCVCCEVEKPGTKKSPLTFNFCLPVTTQFKFGINLGNTTQQPTKDIVKEVPDTNNFSFGLPPINSVGDGLGKNVGESNERTIILEEERGADQQVFVLKSPVTVDTTYDLQTTEPSRKQNSTKVPSALPNTGQGRNTANFNMLSPIEEDLNESSNPGSTSNTQNLSSQNNTLQQNQSSNAGTFGASSFTSVPPSDTPVPPSDTPVPPSDTPVPPSDTPVPDNYLFESNSNSFPPGSSLTITSSPLLNFGSTNNQNPIIIGSTKTMNLKNFFNTKINSKNVLHFGGPSGKCESPTIDSQDNINSAADTNNGNNILGGNGSNTFVRSNEGSHSLNTDNSNLFSSVQSQPQQTGGLFRDQSQTENSSWASSTNVCSAPQGLPTNQRNQAPPLFTFGGMSSDTTSMNNLPTFRKNAHMPSPSPAFGMLPANANNSFNLGSTLLFDNQAKAISNINSTPGAAGGLFGQTSQNFTQNSSLLVETSHEMSLQPSFNFSAGQSPTPNVFNFSQQSGVLSMTGSSPQFQVGSSSAPGQARRIRKAVRRTTPR
ncbi:unnamed protein product [Pieris macdunnoughi]|uniref:Nuclear pore complex protein Nup153 n=1 Tax=Pieris macdunnoughi TaxID=345717 RepID=A0A821LCS4_9NEOP|nr:unnamed protein product [Pieris macdunnoughi]